MEQGTSERSELLSPFLGDWWAEGTSYGGDDQSPDKPHAGASPWRSTHTARWHSGGYFLVQDERANGPFDTLMVIGWDSQLRDRPARRSMSTGMRAQLGRDWTRCPG